MKDIPNDVSGSMLPDASNTGLEARIFRTMALATILAAVGSLSFAHWRITAGVLLGGILSLLNHYWLSSSTAAAFTVLVHGEKPKLKLAQYILRYLVIGAVVFLAYKLNLVSLVATIAGLCSFVVALFAEALREFYFAIIHREETS
ncbi:MAG: ATP synthase subunit I [Pyrinomonadaceae bacterium]